MKALVFILLLVDIAEELSYDIDSKYLYNQLDRGCKNVDIRFDSIYFEKLKNCRVIHGYLRISDMDIVGDISVIFDSIYEITGYLLIDNVKGLKSIGQLFPNLTILRGEILYQGYSLVITNNVDLEYIGTGLMTHIKNGNVRVEKNQNLCYIASVDWMQLRKGLILKIENNNLNCNESCSNCWTETIPQKICTGCDSCLIKSAIECCDSKCIGGCKDNTSDCIACKDYKYIDGNTTKCALYEPLTFQLENYFLVTKETCDEIGHTQLDDECVAMTECPADINHYIVDDKCIYCQNCTFANCSVIVSSIEDLRNISNCQVAKNFEIRNLADSRHESVESLLIEKLQNIVAIQNCVIIQNSSAIADLKFLKRLRKVTGTKDPECEIEGVIYSVIIADNDNLQAGFGQELEIDVNSGIYLENNRNLCQLDVETIVKVFQPQKDSKSVIQSKDCQYPSINIETMITNESALILLDTIPNSEFKINLVYWKDNKKWIDVLNSSYFEIQQLEPNKSYPFKFEVFDPTGTKIYSINYHFFKTLSFNEVFVEAKAFSELGSINITWNSIITNGSDLFMLLTYEEIQKDDCNNLEMTNLNDNKKSERYSKYFMRDPNSMDENFQHLTNKTAKIDQNFISITDLLNSTCYKIGIFVCEEINYLTCKDQATIIQQTLIPTIEETEPESSNLLMSLGILAFVFILVLIIGLFAFVKLRKKKKFEPDIQLQTQLSVEVDKWDLDRLNVVQTKTLGSGEFGIVYQGYIKPDENLLYAIKTLASTRDDNEENFLKEAEIMRKFDAHHVVKLKGYCLKEKPLLLVMEFMKHGDLKKFLTKNKPKAVIEEAQSQQGNYSMAPVSKAAKNPIRPFYEMAIEIADGMLYLSSINFIHCDLACRNLMVHETYTIKIGDFGLARELYHTDYYKPGNRNKKIPLRWIAPEVLGNEEMLPRYTSKSDVFSFGIVLFELLTFCDKPYEGCYDDEVVEIIKTGRTLGKPKDCDDKTYELMQKCWRFNPDERITFQEIVEYFLQNYDIPNFKNVSFYHKNCLTDKVSS